ncbi:four helix bundle protein [Selenihalanaerobacter shriftii]|uniref:Four helix bundle protein n=1 Tax=Selenihalanaerobacter shriftii TaxID=142842 RepID=A0A1T4KVK0_9FIRM|nr:four helix bundle protein [Selenihalanaerobacter shriftii]SJZ46388.1 four helix bundle protein [Selenihalanaerobacter shriftii]
MRTEKSIVYKKAFDFSVRIVNLHKYLSDEKREYTLGKQVLRSGTSIGANIREGLEGQSRKDFVAKLSIALKEAAETEYWLELLNATEILEERIAKSLLTDVKEIIEILNSIIKTTRNSVDSK